MVKVVSFESYICKPEFIQEVSVPTMDTYLRNENISGMVDKRNTFLKITHPSLFTCQNPTNTSSEILKLKTQK